MNGPYPGRSGRWFHPQDSESPIINDSALRNRISSAFTSSPLPVSNLPGKLEAYNLTHSLWLLHVHCQ